MSTELSQPKAPRHLPHMTHPEVLTVGMRPMTGDWLEPAENPAAIRAHKLERRQTLGRAVYAVCPEGLAGAQELAEKVNSWLGRGGGGAQNLSVERQGLMRARTHDRPSTRSSEPPNDSSRNLSATPKGNVVRNFSQGSDDCPSEEALWQASLRIHEDLVVMVPQGDSYSLMAASLCSPSHWRLPEKIGRPMARVHDPIPGIHDRITPRIDRIFQNLRVDTPVERYNWSVQAGSTLFAWPSEHHNPIDPDTPLWYRVERQTLTRLPESGALAFIIRVHLDPLESLLAVPDGLQSLFRAIDATSVSLQHYKTFDWLAPALNKYRALAG